MSITRHVVFEVEERP